MKERPILFSGPMVRALLNGSKTQTRRVVKPMPDNAQSLGLVVGSSGFHFVMDQTGITYPDVRRIRWDRLYVRETWAAPHAYDHLPPRLIPKDARIHYAATEDRGGLLWRPSIHMPRWASRITLEITGVRVERLQDISEADALAEGIECLAYSGLITYRNYALDDELAEVSPMMENPIDSYRSLWESINGPGSWDANPWVWVIEFKRL